MPPQTVRLRQWAVTDLPLLREVNSASMTEHLGGPESEQQVLRRHQRYVHVAAAGTGHMFVIEAGPELVAVGNIGYWDRRWNDEDVYETGWNVLPAFQGRGLATAAARLVADHAADHGSRPALHAYPSVHNAASNAICRKCGFALVGPCDVEYPPGRVIRVNDWRLDLRSGNR